MRGWSNEERAIIIDDTDGWSSPQILKTLLWITGFVFLGWVLFEVSRVLLWVVMAGYIAIALDPLVRRVQSLGPSRYVSIIITVTVAFSVLAIGATVLASPLIAQGSRLVEDMPRFIKQAHESAAFVELDTRFGLLEKATESWESIVQGSASYVTSIFARTVMFAFGTVTVAILAILMLFSGPGISRALLRLHPPLKGSASWTVGASVYTSVSRYVSGTLLVALITGLFGFFALVVLGIREPLPLALWMGISAMIPIVGSTLGVIPALIVAAADAWWKAGVLLAVIVVYQQIESALISPYIVGRVVRLSPLIVFVAVLLGADFLGIAGVLLAVPFAAALQLSVQKLYPPERRPKASSEA